MMSGGTRGAGGDGLSRHWLKPKNEQVITLEGRDLAAEHVRDQVRELTAGTAGARFQQPIYHVHLDPNPADRMPAAAEMQDLWDHMEREFDLRAQPWAGVRHVKARDLDVGKRHESWDGQDWHEHRAYSLKDDGGRMVDALRYDYLRRQRVIAEWQFDHGFERTPCADPDGVERWARQHRPEMLSWLGADDDPKNGGGGHPKNASGGAGTRPVAVLQPAERAQLEQAGVERLVRHARNVLRDALAAWNSSDSAASFEAVLAVKGYRLA